MKRTKPLPHLILDDHDTALAAQARKAIRVAVDSAHQPSAVAKKITVYAVRHLRGKWQATTKEGCRAG
jgi:hypothetical protein